MKEWLRRQLRPIEATTVRFAVVLDPDRLIEAETEQLGGDPVVVRDWYGLRRVYERGGRRRPITSPRLVVLVQSATYREPRDLPFDVEQAATVVRLRVPVPVEFRALALELPDGLSERAVSTLGPPRNGNIDDVLRSLWGVSLGTTADPTNELGLVARLRADPRVPPAVWALLRPRLVSPISRGLAAEPPDVGPLQDAWDRFVQERPPADGGVIGRIGPSLMPLFHLGLMRASPGAREDLPAWAAAGTTEVGADELTRSLLDAPPIPAERLDLSAWVQRAEWWGHVRAAMADLGADPEGLRTRGWDVWAKMDAEFVPWLRHAFGPLLLSSSAIPLTVDKIAPFLAGRVRSGEAERVVLVVLDGMGLAQWALIKRSSGLQVAEGRACLAMVPTLTPISRQAIFRGSIPLYFPETLNHSDRDEEGWRKFWRDHGVPNAGVQYRLVSGSGAGDPSLPGGLTALGMVIQATDKMLHSANVLGDSQLMASLRTWLGYGYLRGLVEDANRLGYEVWLTSDHGNLETEPLGQVQEGLAVEGAGLRVRMYGNPSLRDHSKVREGSIVWDHVPGLPDRVSPLFAPGRGAYFSGDVRVTHGGLSMDEVIVPFVRVVP